MQKRQNKEVREVLHITTKVPFGKYKGKLLIWIMANDIAYVRWLLAESKFKMHRLSEDLIRVYVKYLPRRIW